MAPLLPWLAILALLALKPNRGWSAWWIWLPLAVLAAGLHWLGVAWQTPSSGLPEEMVGPLLAIPLALALGLAALWLLASHLRGRNRLRTFLGTLFVLVVFVVFSFAATAGWGLGVEPISSLLDPRRCSATAGVGELGLPFIVLPVLLALVVAATLSLCGLACQWRQRPWWFCLWLFLSLPTVCVAVSALLHLLCRIASPGTVDYDPSLWFGLLMVGVSFATLLPFLILSSASRFHRERLKAVLHVTLGAPPAIGAA
jgi:hypothetical protein